eukprot:7564-Heterococcus_DN1.PRE.1
MQQQVARAAALLVASLSALRSAKRCAEQSTLAALCCDGNTRVCGADRFENKRCCSSTAQQALSLRGAEASVNDESQGISHLICAYEESKERFMLLQVSAAPAAALAAAAASVVAATSCSQQCASHRCKRAAQRGRERTPKRAV